MPSQPELWSRIDAFSIDEVGAALPFSARLARENRWSRPFSHRVLQEYKRFAYLAMAAGHPVTPSDEVDQAWHLHMVYTRSYWDDFCGQALGRPLHHGPTQGGSQENAKYEDWYARTLASYRAEFGEEPPADIWPASEVRFGRAPHFARVNTAENWVIPKRFGRQTAAAAALGLALFATAGAASSGRDRIPIAAVIGLLILFIIIVLLIRRGGKGGGSGCSSGGCSSSGCSSSDGGDSSGCSSGCGSGCGGGCGGGD